MSRAGIYAGKAVVLIKATDLTEKVIGQVQRRLAGLNNQLGQLGRTSFTTGFFSATGQGILLRRFAKFDDLMLELRVKMGLLKDVTQSQEIEFARLEKRIRSLGKSTSYTTQEVAEGAIRLAQAGFSGKEIEDTLQSVLDLARGTSTDLANSARVLANTIRTFNLETESANQIVSQFVKASRMGTVEIDDLAEGLKYSSATAVELGQSLSTVLAVFTLLSERGMRGSIAGTSFNTAMANMAKKAEDISKMTGLPVPTDANGNLLLVDMIKQLEVATRSLPGIERVKVFQDLFNLRGSRAALALAHESDIQKLIQLAEGISMAGDEARRAAEIMDSRLGGAARRALSALEDLNITLQKIVAGPLTAFLNALPPLINLVDKFALANQNLLMGIMAMPLALAAGGLGLMVFSRVLGTAAKTLGGLKSSIGFLKPLIYGGMSANVLKGLGGGGRTLGSKLAGIGQYPIGAASTVPGIVGSQRAAQLLNARLAPQAALYQLTKSTSANHAAQQYQIYRRNQHLAKLGGPNAAAHVQRAVAAKQAFKVAQANKKAADLGLKGIQARMAPAPVRAARTNIMGSILKGLGTTGRGAKGLFDFSKGIAAMTWSVAKFATRTNVLLGLLQIIILFGDKIPGVSTILQKTGSAFGQFFGTLGSIIGRLTPAFQLMKMSLGMLGNEETAGFGVTGLSASLSTMASIVGVTLVEAWNRFKMTLGGVYDTLRNILSVVWELAKALISVIGTTLGNLIGSIGGQVGSSLGRMSEAFGGGGTIKGFTIGLLEVVGKLVEIGANFIIDLTGALMYFLEEMEIRLAALLAKIFPRLELTMAGAVSETGSRRGLRRQKMEADKAANSQAIREMMQNIMSAFTSSAAQEGALGAANAAKRAENLINTMHRMMVSLGMAAGSAIGPETYNLSPGKMNQIQAVEAVRTAAMQAKVFAAALVGTAAGTRGNTIRAVTEDELKKQTDLLQEIRDNTAQQANAAFV